MFNKLKKMAIEKRLEDQILYEYVLDELEADIKIKGLWAKAYANSGGDNNKIEPLYMQYRVQSIKDLLTAMKIAYESLSKQQIRTYLNDNNLTEEEQEEKIRKEQIIKNQTKEEAKKEFQSVKQSAEGYAFLFILLMIMILLVAANK